MSNDPNDFLMGGGGTSAKFDNVGDTITGTIAATPEVRQQTDPKDGKPKFWDNGDPMNQLVVVLATDQRDPSIDDDDGTRRLYVKGKLQYAVRDAVRAAGAKGLEVGGQLTVKFIGEGEAPFKGASPAKLYEAIYVSAGNAALGAADPAPAAAAAPTAAAAPSAPTGGPSPQDITTAKSLIAAGLDDATVTAAAPTVTPEVLAALRNAAA